jgi:7tm Chemosensory receptor.
MEQFYKEMKPLFYVSRILGIAPYSLAAEGNLTVSIPALVYSIIFNILIVSFPLGAHLHARKRDDVSMTPVLLIGKIILTIATLFTSALSAVISLFRCRELINIIKHALCLCTLTEESFVIHKRFTVTKLLLLGCVPYCTIYFLYCATLDYPLSGVLFMPFLFLFLYSPFLVVVQFACLILLSKRLFSYINTCLGDILSKLSPPTRDNLITLSSLGTCLHSTNLEPIKVSSISLPPNKRKAGCIHLLGMSTSLSKTVCARPRNLTSHVNIDSTCLSSPKFTLGLRVQILSLINFHDELCVIVRSINSVYSVHILVNVAEAFICITVSLFCSYFLPTKPNLGTLSLIFIFIICWSLTKLLVLLYACTRCTEEVSKYSEVPEY